MVRRDPVYHQPVGQGEVQGGAVRSTQESGTSLAAQVGRNAVLRQQGRLLHHSWSVAPRWVQMVQSLCPTKWKGISGTQGWGLEWSRRVQGSRVTMSF